MWTSVDSATDTPETHGAGRAGTRAATERGERIPNPAGSGQPVQLSGTTSTVRIGSTSWKSFTFTSWVPIDLIGSSRRTSWRSTS